MCTCYVSGETPHAHYAFENIVCRHNARHICIPPLCHSCCDGFVVVVPDATENYRFYHFCSCAKSIRRNHALKFPIVKILPKNRAHMRRPSGFIGENGEPPHRRKNTSTDANASCVCTPHASKSFVTRHEKRFFRTCSWGDASPRKTMRAKSTKIYVYPDRVALACAFRGA